MRWLLVLALLAVSVPGCCCPAAPGPECAAYTPGYRRPCYPAYRPIDSASLP